MFLILAGAANAGDVPERDLTYFLRRLRTVDHLPELEASRTAMQSTWSRNGDNKDGGDFKNIVRPTADTPGCNILLDVDGPGCIHRIFTGTLADRVKDTRIQIFLDHNQTPIFDMPMVEFFNDTNGPFPYPLVFHKSYPGTLFPIPFAKHCLVRLVNENFGKAGVKAGSWDWGNFWQVTYTRYSVPVKSLVWPPDEAEKKEIAATAQAWLEAESTPPGEPAQWTTDQTITLEPGKSMVVDLQGAGVIRQMRVSAKPATPEVLRGARLQIAWDGAADPSVDVPVGHFFGHAYSGHGKKLSSRAAVLGRERPLEQPLPLIKYSADFNSLLLGVTPTEAYSRFPMPFAKGAVVTIQNRSGSRIENLRLRLEVEPLATLPPEWGRFHATWTEAPAATEKTPVFGPLKLPGKVALQKQGRGKYVGVMLTLDWPHLGWWGEGDWLIWTDEDGWPPSYHGTGSEEYFNSGWCQFDRKAVSGFVALRPGHPTVYSFHLNDAFQFQKNIKVVEEQMQAAKAGEENPSDKVIRETHPLWTTTAYWYAGPAQPAGSD
jgi:hypothetical protein